MRKPSSSAKARRLASARWRWWWLRWRWQWALFFVTLLLVIVSLLTLLLLLHRHTDHDHHRFGVKAIYQFGDSLSDTGNFIIDNSDTVFARLPYGQNFHNHQPTGRCSDGLIITDYIAQYFKLPLLDPYLKKDGNFDHGVNFAVAGSTALDLSTLSSKNLQLPSTNKSLSVQLKWFQSHLDSICQSPSDCRGKLRNALFMMGEIGGNDVLAISKRKTMEERQKLLPDVVQAVVKAVKDVIDLGAIRVVVPGNFPLGCMPVYLVLKTDNSTKYDELKCLKEWNDLSKLQNDLLQNALGKLQKEHPHVAIVYGDLYSAYREILRSARALGFDENATRKTCCGSGNNPYNFDWSKMCGFGAPVCPDPDARVCWDGIHLTSHAYQHMARSLLKQIAAGISHAA